MTIFYPTKVAQATLKCCPALIEILAVINIFHFNFYEVGNTIIHAGDKGPYLSAVSWYKPETLCP